MSALMIGGRTVTRDGEKVATLTFAGREVTIWRPDGEIAGRLFKVTEHGQEDLYDAYAAGHIAPTPSDRRLSADLPLAVGIALVLGLEDG